MTNTATAAPEGRDFDDVLIAVGRLYNLAYLSQELASSMLYEADGAITVQVGDTKTFLIDDRKRQVLVGVLYDIEDRLDTLKALVEGLNVARPAGDAS